MLLSGFTPFGSQTSLRNKPIPTVPFQEVGFIPVGKFLEIVPIRYQKLPGYGKEFCKHPHFVKSASEDAS
jgi:hypothetical protein